MLKKIRRTEILKVEGHFQHAKILITEKRMLLGGEVKVHDLRGQNGTLIDIMMKDQPEAAVEEDLEEAAVTQEECQHEVVSHITIKGHHLLAPEEEVDEGLGGVSDLRHPEEVRIDQGLIVKVPTDKGETQEMTKKRRILKNTFRGNMSQYPPANESSGNILMNTAVQTKVIQRTKTLMHLQPS